MRRLFGVRDVLFVATASRKPVVRALRPTTTKTPIALQHRLQSVRQLAISAPAASHVVKQVQLRPYQEESIQAVLDHLAKGERRLAISLATGSGKTVIFSHLVDRIPPPNEDATQTLIMAHRRELVEQAAKHCQALYPNKVVDVEMAASQASGFADITVASVASLNARDGTRLLKFDPKRFKLIIVDEVHHIVAPQYLNVLRHFGLLDGAEKPATALVGVSATLSRADGLSLGKAIDHIVYHKDYLDMIESDFLSGIVFTTVRSTANLSKVKTSRGDFQAGALSKAVNNDEMNACVVRAWLEKASSRKSTLVFCVDLAHVASLTAMFRQHGIDARFVTGDTDNKVRKERLEDFKAGIYPVLLNCGIFTEGTDIPNIDCITLARPTRSRNLLVQMIGRGLRKHPGKVDCRIIDFVSALETGIVTTPTLFGLDPDTLIDEADESQMKTMKERKEKERLREQQANMQPGTVPALTGNVVFTDYEDVNELIEDTSGERHIRAISQYAWVQIDENRYVLSSTAGDIDLVRIDNRYEVIWKQSIPADMRSKAPYMRPRRVARGDTFEHAVRAADKVAQEKFVYDLVAKTARWRSYPASDNQIALLNRHRDDEDKIESGSITKGRAGDWITKLKRGARGRFNRIAAEKRKAETVDEKKTHFQTMQRKAEVNVGPVA